MLAISTCPGQRSPGSHPCCQPRFEQPRRQDVATLNAILRSIVGPPRSVAYVGLRCFACVAGQTAPRYFKMLTARATTKAMVSRATADWSSMSIFAHRDSGIVSVGLKATALVNDT